MPGSGKLWKSTTALQLARREGLRRQRPRKQPCNHSEMFSRHDTAMGSQRGGEVGLPNRTCEALLKLSEFCFHRVTLGRRVNVCGDHPDRVGDDGDLMGRESRLVLLQPCAGMSLRDLGPFVWCGFAPPRPVTTPKKPT